MAMMSVVVVPNAMRLRVDLQFVLDYDHVGVLVNNVDVDNNDDTLVLALVLE